jgi:alkanesulfonate monooxygenase SsuD/methylene tetrahydromethanopterin reductase-like flavin-dependent oxidoreductase (luciferase family)
MFGLPIMSHTDRYNCAEEWITIIRRLWTEDDTFDFDGKFYRIAKGYLEPKPIQYPHPAIMNAGASERGRHFACKNADLVYTVIRNQDPAVNKAHVANYHALARDEYDRDIRVWSLANIVQGETEKEAREFYDYYVNQKGDWDAAGNVVTMMAAEINERNYQPDLRRKMQEAFVSGWGGHNLVGTKEQIVDGLIALSNMGLDGELLAFPRYEEGMREFRDVTLPLVKQAGLRDFL